MRLAVIKTKEWMASITDPANDLPKQIPTLLHSLSQVSSNLNLHIAMKDILHLLEESHWIEISNHNNNNNSNNSNSSNGKPKVIYNRDTIKNSSYYNDNNNENNDRTSNSIRHDIHIRDKNHTVSSYLPLPIVDAIIAHYNSGNGNEKYTQYQILSKFDNSIPSNSNRYGSFTTFFLASSTREELGKALSPWLSKLVPCEEFINQIIATLRTMNRSNDRNSINNSNEVEDVVDMLRHLKDWGWILFAFNGLIYLSYVASDSPRWADEDEERENTNNNEDSWASEREGPRVQHQIQDLPNGWSQVTTT